MTATDTCPCGNGKHYLECCGLYLEQGVYPQDPEALMRSRYTAYAKRRKSYLVKTWHPKTCPNITLEELSQTTWVNLNVMETEKGLKKSTVTFEATYREGDEEKSFRECSVFKKVKNRWVYLGEEN